MGKRVSRACGKDRTETGRLGGDRVGKDGPITVAWSHTITNGVKDKMGWDAILSRSASEVLVTGDGRKSRKLKVESRNG